VSVEPAFGAVASATSVVPSGTPGVDAPPRSARIGAEVPLRDDREEVVARRSRPPSFFPTALYPPIITSPRETRRRPASARLRRSSLSTSSPHARQLSVVSFRHLNRSERQNPLESVAGTGLG